MFLPDVLAIVSRSQVDPVCLLQPMTSFIGPFSLKLLPDEARWTWSSSQAMQGIISPCSPHSHVLNKCDFSALMALPWPLHVNVLMSCPWFTSACELCALRPAVDLHGPNWINSLGKWTVIFSWIHLRWGKQREWVMVLLRGFCSWTAMAFQI